jgi:hypothetical protein
MTTSKAVILGWLYQWLSLDEIGERRISQQEQVIVRSLLAGGQSSRGPFFQLGWVQGLNEWIDSIPSTGHGPDFTADVKQFNASPDSALLRLKRQNGAVFWFKAAGPPNAHESRITNLLAYLYPTYLPALIARHDAWKGWLMEDAGFPLDSLRSIRLPTLEHMVRRLAELQIASAKQIPALLLAGCRDQRTPALLAGIHELVPYLHEAMSKQKLDSVSRIDSGRLRNIEEVLEQACFSPEWLGVPNGLIHGDIHPGNILINGRRCVFTDWARASVGNPFITFAQLRDQLAQERRTHTWLPAPLRLIKTSGSHCCPTLSSHAHSPSCR